MRVSPKLHKPVRTDGAPKMRPTVAVDSCLAARASEVLADVLIAVTEGTESIECKSIEHILNKIDRAKIEAERSENKIIIACTVPRDENES